MSKNEEALIHSLKYLKDKNNEEFEVVVNLQPTSPCRLSGLLDKTIEAYYNGGHDSLLTATKDTPFLWRKENGKWIYEVDKNDCCDRKMRQDFEESEFLYHDCGSVYITDSKILLDRECRIGYNPCVFEIKGINRIQVDKDFDFELIENMVRALRLESLI